MDTTTRAVTPLRQRMLGDMRMRKFAELTLPATCCGQMTQLATLLCSQC